MPQLITTEFAQACLTDLTAEEITSLPAAIGAVSRAFEQLCDRPLARRPALSRVLTIDPEARTFALPYYPVNEIIRLDSHLETVLEIQQTNTAANQKARVSTVNTGDPEEGFIPTAIRLERTASGVATGVVLTFADFPTVQSLANAAGALGLNWSATIVLDRELWPTADFHPRGRSDALAPRTAELKQWTRSLDYTLDAESGIVTLDNDQDVAEGENNILAVMDIGFTTTPDDLASLTVDALNALFSRRRSQPNVVKEKIKNLEWTYTEVLDFLPASVRQGLAGYQRRC